MSDSNDRRLDSMIEDVANDSAIRSIPIIQNNFSNELSKIALQNNGDTK